MKIFRKRRALLGLALLLALLAAGPALGAGSPTLSAAEGTPDGVLSRGETWQVRAVITLAPGEALAYTSALIGGLRIEGEVAVTAPGSSTVRDDGGVSGNIWVEAEGGPVGGPVLILYTLRAPSPCWPAGVNTASHGGTFRVDGSNVGLETVSLPAQGGQAGIALGLDEDDGGITADRGGPILYTVEWWSTVSANTMPGVIATQTVPAWTRFDASRSEAGWRCSGEGGPGSVCELDLGDVLCLAGGGASRRSSTFAVIVDPETPPSVSEIRSTVDARVLGTSVAATAREVTPLAPYVPPPEPDLVLGLAGPTSAEPGETLSYSLTATQAGTGTATQAAIEAVVPAGTIFAGGAGWGPGCPTGSGPGTLCRRELGSIAEGDTKTAVLTLRVDGALPAGGAPPIEVSAEAVLAQVDPTPSNNSASWTTTLMDGAPDLVITKTPAVQSAGLGDPVSWTLRITNEGTRGASGVEVIDTFSGELIRDPATTAAGSCSPGSGPAQVCTFTRPILEVGETWVIPVGAHLVETLLAALPSTLNTATVSDDGANGADADPTSNTATARVDLVLGPGDGPEVRVEKSVEQDVAQPAAALDYRVTIRNAGNIGSGPVRVEDRIPVGTRLVSASSWSCEGSSPGSLCSFTRSTLAPGESQVLSLRVVVEDDPIPLVDTILNRAEVFEGGAFQDFAEVEVPFELRPGDGPDLEMGKVADRQAVPTGGTVVWTLRVTNVGNLPAVGALVADTLPAELEVLSAPGLACTGGGVEPWRCAATVDLGPGESWERVIETRVRSPLLAGTTSLTNTAEVSLDADVDPTNDQATATVALEVGTGSGPDMAITLSADRGEVEDGETLTYTVGAEAVGSIGSEAVEVILERPEGARWAPTGMDPCWVLETARAVCALGTAEVGDQWSLDLPVIADPGPEIFELVGRAEVRSAVDVEPSNDVAILATPIRDTTPPPRPDLRLEWQAGEPVYPGERLFWTLVLSHKETSEVEATDIRVEARSTTTDLSAWIRESDGGVCGDGACLWTLPRLDPGESVSWSIEVEAPPASSMAVVAEATSAEPDAEPVDNRASSSIRILSLGGPSAVSLELLDVPDRQSAYGDLLAEAGLQGAEVIEYHVSLRAPEGLGPSRVAVLARSTSPETELVYLEGSLAVPSGITLEAGERMPELVLPALAPGEELQWHFAAAIPPELVGSLPSVQWQLRLGTSDGGIADSDDPETDADEDPTVTRLGGGPGAIPEVPTAGEAGLLLLALLLAWAAIRQLSGRWVPSW